MSPRITERKPAWLRMPRQGGEDYNDVKRLLRTSSLNTVCESANCPNRGECFNSRTATFMLLGDVLDDGQAQADPAGLGGVERLEDRLLQLVGYPLALVHDLDHRLRAAAAREQIDPVAVALGPLKVRWYGLMYLLGFVAAWWLGRRRAASKGWTAQQVDDMIFFVAVGVIAGGRILADNERVLTVAVDWQVIRRSDDRAEIFRRLSGWIDVPVEEMEA